MWMIRAALEDSHVLTAEADVACQANNGAKWWAWVWCRDSHKRLLRFAAHDGPDSVQESMLGLINVRKDLERHISEAEEAAEADEEFDAKKRITEEIRHSKSYIADME